MNRSGLSCLLIHKNLNIMKRAILKVKKKRAIRALAKILMRR